MPVAQRDVRLQIDAVASSGEVVPVKIRRHGEILSVFAVNRSGLLLRNDNFAVVGRKENSLKLSSDVRLQFFGRRRCLRADDVEPQKSREHRALRPKICRLRRKFEDSCRPKVRCPKVTFGRKLQAPRQSSQAVRKNRRHTNTAKLAVAIGQSNFLRTTRRTRPFAAWNSTLESSQFNVSKSHFRYLNKLIESR